MEKPRVVIADTDITYIVPLQLKFVKEFFQKIDLEIITDEEYFEELFLKPQKMEVLIVAEDLYNSSLQRHNIGNIFVMTEQNDDGGTAELNIMRLFKYTSIKEIFNEIVGKSRNILNIENKEKKKSQVLVVTSANGGAGKTTIAMGISACLTKNYKNVLYINASRLQSFQYMLDNKTKIISAEIYTKLLKASSQIYTEIKHVIRKELFYYLPAFKAALMSLGLNYSIYEQIIMEAKESNEYDFIVVDAETTFDEYKTKLLDMADKVLVVTGQTKNAVYATNEFISNVNDTNSDKYIFVCNNFDKEGENVLISPSMQLKFTVNDYIDKMKFYDDLNIEVLSNDKAIQRVAFLLL